MGNYNMEAEVWKDVEGYEGLYEVSSLGNVKSVSRTIEQSNGYSREFEGRVLKPGEKGKGYYFVCLFKENKGVSFYVHHLVAYNFLEKQETKKQINHINGDKKDNRLKNLELVTPSENALHSYRELNGSYNINNKKLSQKVKQMDCERNIIKEFPSIREIGRQLGYNNYSLIKALNTGCKAYGYYWERVK